MCRCACMFVCGNGTDGWVVGCTWDQVLGSGSACAWQAHGYNEEKWHEGFHSVENNGDGRIIFIKRVFELRCFHDTSQTTITKKYQGVHLRRWLR